MNIKVDAMDEQLLLALREGPPALQSLTNLAGIYNALTLVNTFQESGPRPSTAPAIKGLRQ